MVNNGVPLKRQTDGVVEVSINGTTARCSNLFDKPIKRNPRFVGGGIKGELMNKLTTAAVGTII